MWHISKFKKKMSHNVNPKSVMCSSDEDTMSIMMPWWPTDRNRMARVWWSCSWPDALFPLNDNSLAGCWMTTKQSGKPNVISQIWSWSFSQMTSGSLLTFSSWPANCHPGQESIGSRIPVHGSSCLSQQAARVTFIMIDDRTTSLDDIIDNGFTPGTPHCLFVFLCFFIRQFLVFSTVIV